MKKKKYTNAQKRALKKKFSKLSQKDLLEVAAQCNVQYSTVRVVRNMHSVSEKIINALIFKSEQYENAKTGKSA